MLAYNSLSFYAPTLQPFLKQQVSHNIIDLHPVRCPYLHATVIQFNLNPVQVGLVFFISSAPYTLASFFVGSLSEKVVSAHETTFSHMQTKINYIHQ